MDSGLRTPLLDFFRRGEVARDIRLQAAQGGMAPRAHEQIGLLMLLVEDPDPEIAAAAEATVAAIPPVAIQAFLARSDASLEMREFFALRGVERGEIPWAEIDKPLIDVDQDDAAPEPLLDGEEPPP